MEDRLTPAAAFALSGSNLLAFDTASPVVIQTTPITGINAGETLVGIDFRPQNGLLYGLGIDASNNAGTVYAISTRTGVSSAVGTAGSVSFTTDGATPVDLPDPATTGYGFDFNPAADRIRVVTGSGLNFRLNPNTGGPVDGDNTGLTSGAVNGFNPDGPISGGTTTLDASAYTNNQPNNANVTTLYGLDAAGNGLFLQNPPNVGTATLGQTVTLGGNPLDFTAVNGFDIQAGVNAPASNLPVSAGTAFAVLNVGGTTGLYTINLVNAQATLVGNVGNGVTAVQGFAVQSDLGGISAIAMSVDGANLLRFNTVTPGTVTTQAINTAALVSGETLVGIDFRPATGQLYGLGINHNANTGTLYIVDPQNGGISIAVSGTASGVSFAGEDLPDPAVTGYGFDFNPDVDRIRVTTGTGLNFRINPNSGQPVAATTDGDINGLGSGGISATAYTNSFGNDVAVTATTQYTLDAAQNTLFIQNPPNNGTQSNPLPVTLGGNPLDFTEVSGFDIPAGVRVSTSSSVAQGFGYATLTVAGVTGLYQIDLATGAAVNRGAVGAGVTGLTGLALGDAAAGAVFFAASTGSINEANASAVIDLTRTGGNVGPLTVTINVTGGTAAAGLDFTAGPFTATFADGASVATFTIPVLDDSIFEGNETIVLTIAAVNSGVIASPNVSTLTITETDPQQTFSVNQASGYALVNGALVPITTKAPSAAGNPISLSGLAAGDMLVAIDYRPQNGLLYGFGVNAAANTGTLYLISPRGGFAGVIGTAGSIAFDDGAGNPVDLPDPATVRYEIDFNPAVDRLRIVAGGLNFRVNPNNGTPIDGNTGLANIQTDGLINGGVTGVSGTAYTNNFPNNGGVTTQYTIEPANNNLYIQNPPNNGTQTGPVSITVGGNPLDFTDVKGFDILANVNAATSNAAPSAGTAFAILTVGGTDKLYSINLVSGAATTLGPIGFGSQVATSLAFQSDLGAVPYIALNAAGTQLIRAVGSASPFVVPITGIAGGESLVGIDFRPATGQFYGLGVNATANNATLYLIDPQTGAAVAVGVAGSIAFTDGSANPVDFADPVTAGYGFDFNPTVDRIRVVSSVAGLNFRINPNNGVPVDGDLGGAAGSVTGTNTDGNINGPGGPTGISAAAYTNSFGTGGTPATPVGVTTQYTLDASLGRLNIQNPPNSGTQTIPIVITGPASGFTAVSGFDIPESVRVTNQNAIANGGFGVAGGFGYAALTVGGVSSLYRIDLRTGESVKLNDFTSGFAGLALVQTPDVAPGQFVASSDENTVKYYNPDGTLRYSAAAFGPSPNSGVHSAAGDFNRDGVNDVVIGSGNGIAARVIVRDGVSQVVLFDLTPFGAGFTGGAFVAAGDLTGDGIADLAVSAGERGGPRVRVFDGSSFTQIADFFGVGGSEFRGGARVAFGDYNADGRADLSVAAGTGGGPRVATYDGRQLGSNGGPTLFGDILVFEAALRNGAFISAGDVNNDGFADLVTGAGQGGAPRVKIIDGRSLVTSNGLTQTIVGDYFAGNSAGRDGVGVSARLLNNDFNAEVLAGADGRVKAFSGSTITPGITPPTIFDIEPFSNFTGGVYVG